MTGEAVSSSWRDRSGTVYVRDGTLLRQVNQSFRADYNGLIDSGLYDELVGAGLLIDHEEQPLDLQYSDEAYRVIRPTRIPFVSYPYEWCFSQLQDAALLVLEVQRRALERGMWLKDSSGFNVQFLRGRPLLIDTLSLERYPEGAPWTAYGQFCRHFLAPLALAAYVDVRLTQLLREHIDGIPIDLASRLLPRRTWGRVGLGVHLHLHAMAQRRYGNRAGREQQAASKQRTMSRMALSGFVDSLRSAVRKLRWKPGKTAWSDYYADTNYSPEAFDHKRRLVAEFLDDAAGQTVWDLGANTGEFSRIAAEKGSEVLSFDVDPAVVERNYRQMRDSGQTNLLPLWLDLTNPTPAIGWANQERLSLAERGPADAVLALALVHHLAIGNNVPWERIAGYFRMLGAWLVVEFVPKTDSRVQRMLATRRDIFDRYTRPHFERAFAKQFHIERSESIGGSDRTLYLMRARA